MATPITLDIEVITKWAGLVTAFLTAVGLIIRFITKYIRKDRRDTAIADADMGLYKKLQDEIARLERIIILQQTQAENEAVKMNLLRDLELDGATDMGQLTMIVAHMPCQNCTLSSESIEQLTEVVTRMNNRRIVRQRVIRGEVQHVALP